jgi:DNA polymerase IV
LHRHIIHIHIQAFSIAVARVCRPELRDRPVAVAPARTERALIMSVSAEALKEGVFKGMPLSRAVKRCPGLKVLPPDPGPTERAAHTLARMAAQYTPLWEPSRPGHIYLDVTGTERLWGGARDAALRLHREIKDRLDLPGTAGVAGNKMVSSIASRTMPSSEGVLGVDHGGESSFMAPFRVGVVPGIGRLRKRMLLEELNIIRVRELAALDMGSMRLLFGRQALLIHQRSLGIDPTPVYSAPAKPVVSEEVTLARDENDDPRLLGALYGLVERCAGRLRERGLIPRKAGLVIRYSDHVEVQRRAGLKRSSFWEFDLYSPVEEMFFSACTRRVRVRFMRVRFWDLSRSSGQLSLFQTRPPFREKRSSVIQAMDSIRKRHGEGAIRFGRAA